MPSNRRRLSDTRKGVVRIGLFEDGSPKAHDNHGRGDEDGPFDECCPCTGTGSQQECAEAGCGFCIAAIEMEKHDES